MAAKVEHIVLASIGDIQDLDLAISNTELNTYGVFESDNTNSFPKLRMKIPSMRCLPKFRTERKKTFHVGQRGPFTRLFH